MENKVEKDSDFMSNLCIVMTNIYTSCDPLETDNVKVSKLVNYIEPYMLGDLSALDCLRNALDPNLLDICVNRQTFYNAMNEWAKKISNSDDEDSFNRTPSQLDYIDDKEVQYNQSTPRASFGQKLLDRSMDILNISNVSTYSTIGNRTTGIDVANLEEKIRMQEHEIHKCKNDLAAMKHQLTLFEDQNDVLQADLGKANKKLRSEQLLIEHLQKQIAEQEEIKEEISNYRKKMDNLSKKNTTAERDHERLMAKIVQLEQEKEKLEAKCDEMSKREQEAKKQIFDVKLEMDIKEINIADLMQLTESYKNDLSEKKDLIDYLRGEIEQLSSQNTSLNRALKDKRLYRNCVPVQTDLDSSMSQNNSTSPNAELLVPADNSPGVSPVIGDTPAGAPQCLRKMVLMRGASTPQGSPRNHKALAKRKILSPVGQGDESDDSYNTHVELMKQYATMDSLQVEISRMNDVRECNCETLSEKLSKYERDLEEFESKRKEAQARIGQLEMDNRELKEEISHARKQREELENRLSGLERSKRDVEERLGTAQTERDKLTWEHKNLLMERRNIEKEVLKLTQDKNELESQLASVQSEKLLLMQELRLTELHNIEIRKDLQLNVEKVAELKDRSETLSQAQTKFETIKATLVEKEKLVEELSKTIKSNGEWKKILQEQLQGEIQEKSVTIRTLDEENNVLKQKLDELKFALDVADSNKLKLHDVNQRVLETTNQIEKHLQQKTLLVQELQKINGRLSDSVEQMETDMQEKLTQIRTLQNEMKNDMDTKISLFEELKKMKAENQKLSEEHGILRQENKEMLVDYNRCKTDLHNLKRQLDEDEVKYRDMCRQKNEFMKKVETLMAQHADDLKHIEELRVKLSNVQHESIPEAKPTFGKHLVKIERLQSRVDNLEQKLESERRRNDKCSKEKDELRTLNKKLEGQLVEVDKDVVNLRSLNKKLHEENRLIQTSHVLEESNRLNKEFGEEKRCLEQEVQKLTLKITDCDSALAQMNCRLEERNGVNKKLVEEKRCLQQEVQQLTLKITDCDSALAQMNCRLEERNGVNKKLVEEKRCLQQEVQKLTLKITDCNNALAQMNCRLEERNGVNKKLDEEKRCLQREVQKLTLKLTDCNNEISQMHSTLEQSNSLNKELHERKRCLLQEVQKLTVEITDCNDKLIHMNGTMERNHKRLIELEATVDVLKEEKYLLMNSEDKLKEQLASKDQIVERLSEDLEALVEKSRAIEENEERLRGTVGLLKSTEMELKLIVGKVDKCKEKLDCFDGELKGRIGVLASGRQELARHTVAALKLLRKYDQDLATANGKLFEEVERDDFLDSTGDPELELKKLVKQIKVATVLLEIISIKFPKHMEVAEADCDDLDSISSRLHPPEMTNLLSKLTLKPSCLLLNRPESPDSPSMEVLRAKELINVECGVPESPDSDGKKMDAASHRYRPDESFITADGDSLHQTEEEVSYCSELELISPFPHITDSFLEKLGLHETSELKKLTKEETERLFTTLVIQLTIDSNDYKDRRQNQKEELSLFQEKLFKLIKEMTFRLRDHHCVDPIDSIKPVFILMEELKVAVEKALASAAQYGIVSYEGRMMKCWNLVTNYTAMLRRGNESSAAPSTRESPTQTQTTTDNVPRQRFKKRDGSKNDAAMVTQDGKTIIRQPSHHHACKII